MALICPKSVSASSAAGERNHEATPSPAAWALRRHRSTGTCAWNTSPGQQCQRSPCRKHPSRFDPIGGVMRAHRIHPVSLLLTLVALIIAPALDGLQAQTTLDCKCSQSTPMSSQRSLVLQGGGWLVDMDAT